MLTEVAIKNLRPKDKAFKVGDNGGLGLFIRVQPNGSKLWQMKYRNVDGAERLASFGKWPTCTGKIAREEALKFKRELLQGRDLLAEKMAAREAAETTGKTFREVAEQWFADWKTDKVRAHSNRVHSRLKRDIFPVIGKRAIGTIAAPDVVRMCKAIEGRGVGETARRVFQSCDAVFKFAVGLGYCERNPCADTDTANVLKPITRRNHARVSDAKLPAVLRALWTHPGIVTRMAARLTVYTILRTDNVIALEWAWCDLDAARITIPRGEMKEKDSNRPAFVCVLSQQAVEVLRFMRQLSCGERYVFAGHSEGRHLSNGAMLKALRDAGFGGKMTMHAWRAVFTTWAAGAGFPKDYVEAQMDHAKRGVRAHYDFQQFIEQRGPLMAAWGKHVETMAAAA